MKSVVSLVVALALAGCSVPLIQPDPSQEVAGRFASGLPSGTEPLDMDWWSRTGDAQLTELLSLAMTQSPDLRSAAAQVLAARAAAGQSAAGQFPALTGQASSTRSHDGGGATTQTDTAYLSASWEIDLFAAAARSAEASRLRARSEDFTYAGAYVSLAGEVADTYVRYRACRLVEGVYRQALASQRETLEATLSLSGAGLRAGSDLSLARANVASSQISLQTQRADCRVLAQTLATVVGVGQDRIDAILSHGGGLPSSRPFRVAEVPAGMLRQRPDVVAAELDFAASLRDLDAAQADLWPSLSLSGTITLSDPASWSFGPALSLPIFDAGRRRAAVRGANADALVAAERYRASVLSAVAEAEGALTRLNAAAANLGSAGTLVDEYTAYFQAVDSDWQAGGVSLLDREEARRQMQSAQITRITQRETLLRQWIALYKAMGGGWSHPASPQLPS